MAVMRDTMPLHDKYMVMLSIEAHDGTIDRVTQMLSPPKG